LGRSVLGVDGGVWPRGMGPINAIAQREVDFCGFPIKWGPQRVGPGKGLPQLCNRSEAVSNQVGAPASGASAANQQCFPCPAGWVSNQVGAPASGARIALRPESDAPTRGVSNQVGAPASGAINALPGDHRSLPVRFPIKWGPQRVGPQLGSIVTPAKSGFLVSNQVGAPASGAPRKPTAGSRTAMSFQSSGGPSEWGHLLNALPNVFLPEFPIKWGPQRVGPGKREGGREEGGREVSNQVGAPASGAQAKQWRDSAEVILVFPIKWGPQRVGPPPQINPCCIRVTRG
jgi:hypothetical protein